MWGWIGMFQEATPPGWKKMLLRDAGGRLGDVRTP